MTKKEYAARNAAWRLALAEGRVVRFNGGLTMKSFKTPEAAQEFCDEITQAGNVAEIVKVPSCRGIVERFG